MATIKLNIALDTDLLERVDALAEELDLSRSGVLAQAAEELLRRLESQRLLDCLDEVYGGESAVNDEEVSELRRMRHRRFVGGTW